MRYFLTRVYNEGNEILMVVKINKQLDEDVAIYKSESGFHLIDMASGLSIVNTKYLSDPSRSHIRKVLIDYLTDHREELRASLSRLRVGRNMSTPIQKDGYWLSKHIPQYTNSWKDYTWTHVKEVLESMQDELEKLGEGAIYAKIGRR